MKLIEISHNIHLNTESICNVTVSTSERMESKDLGGGLRGHPRKVGEETSISITTSDGVTHRVDADFVQDVHDLLFPTEE